MNEKTTLVLVPGLLCDGAVWRHQVEHLEELEGLCRITVADLGNCSSLEDVVSRILDQAPPTFALAGHSMGGWIALEIMRRHPERVSKLCLLDTTAEVDDETVRERRVQMIDEARLGKIAGVIDRIIQAFVMQQDVAPSVREMFLRNQGRFIFQEELMMAREDCLQFASRLSISPLLIVGSGDHAFYSFMVSLHRAMPLSQFVVIEGAGHMTTMEKPEEVTILMRKWIEA